MSGEDSPTSGFRRFRIRRLDLFQADAGNGNLGGQRSRRDGRRRLKPEIVEILARVNFEGSLHWFKKMTLTNGNRIMMALSLTEFSTMKLSMLVFSTDTLSLF